jgi:hypothetical protein
MHLPPHSRVDGRFGLPRVSPAQAGSTLAEDCAEKYRKAVKDHSQGSSAALASLGVCQAPDARVCAPFTASDLAESRSDESTTHFRVDLLLYEFQGSRCGPVSLNG